MSPPSPELQDPLGFGIIFPGWPREYLPGIPLAAWRLSKLVGDRSRLIFDGTVVNTAKDIPLLQNLNYLRGSNGFFQWQRTAPVDSACRTFFSPQGLSNCCYRVPELMH